MTSLPARRTVCAAPSEPGGDPSGACIGTPIAVDDRLGVNPWHRERAVPLPTVDEFMPARLPPGCGRPSQRQFTRAWR